MEQTNTVIPSIKRDQKKHQFMHIPFSPPDISQEEIDEVVDTLKSGWITTGPKTKMFEAQIADYCHTEKAAAMNSATAAMEMTLRLLGIGEGDEVITTAYTYTASASVIDHVGAKIVLVDSGKDSYQIDYDSIADAITEKTKAIIAVDIAGIMCDYKKIFDIVNSKRKLFSPNNTLQQKFNRIIVIADAAHSFGASYYGNMSGEVADFTCFSFHAVKNLTTAEGGSVTWKNIENVNNQEIYNDFMILSLHGQTKDAMAKTKLGSWEYDILSTAYKCNMTDIMASLGLAQFKRYPSLLIRRRQLIEMYEEGFKELNVEIIQHYTEESISSGHLFLVRLTNKSENYRNQFIEKMAEYGIATNVHYKPLPMHTAYKNLGFNIDDFPNAEAVFKNEITLPLHTRLTDEEITYVIETFKNILKNDLVKG